jgi:predicted nuclease with TOPRIM domain
MLKKENFAEKLKNYEKENNLLNENNKKLLDELYAEKENNKRLYNLEFTHEQLKETNQALALQLQKLSSTGNYHTEEKSLPKQLHDAFCLPQNVKKENQSNKFLPKSKFPCISLYFLLISIETFACL